MHRCLFSFFAGIPRYPALAMVRPSFPPRPPGAPVVLPAGSRPLVPGAPNVRPVIAPLVRPVIPFVTPAEKPQTTVYVGKIASTVEDDFMRSVLQVYFGSSKILFLLKKKLMSSSFFIL